MSTDRQDIADRLNKLSSERLLFLAQKYIANWDGVKRDEIEHVRNRDEALLAEIMLSAAWLTSLSENGKAELLADIEGAI